MTHSLFICLNCLALWIMTCTSSYQYNSNDGLLCRKNHSRPLPRQLTISRTVPQLRNSHPLCESFEHLVVHDGQWCILNHQLYRIEKQILRLKEFSLWKAIKITPPTNVRTQDPFVMLQISSLDYKEQMIESYEVYNALEVKTYNNLTVDAYHLVPAYDISELQPNSKSIVIVYKWYEHGNLIDFMNSKFFNEFFDLLDAVNKESYAMHFVIHFMKQLTVCLKFWNENGWLFAGFSEEFIFVESVGIDRRICDFRLFGLDNVVDLQSIDISNVEPDVHNSPEMSDLKHAGEKNWPRKPVSNLTDLSNIHTLVSMAWNLYAKMCSPDCVLEHGSLRPLNKTQTVNVFCLQSKQYWEENIVFGTTFANFNARDEWKNAQEWTKFQYSSTLFHESGRDKIVSAQTLKRPVLNVGGRLMKYGMGLHGKTAEFQLFRLIMMYVVRDPEYVSNTEMLSWSAFVQYMYYM